jgi:transcription elongation GreA/GreB family factor
MAERLNSGSFSGREGGTGLLLHELVFVEKALAIARGRRDSIAQIYGESVASSGGDWVFDDPASQAAAMEVAKEKGNVAYFEQLIGDTSLYGIVDYPHAESLTVGYGSRVTLREDDMEETYDIVTHRISGIPYEESRVEAVISPAAPLGSALMHAMVGETVIWKTPNGGKLSAELVAIDQVGQEQYYHKLFGQH